MRDLVELVDRCFESGGPFVASIHGGSYRETQHRMAVDLAKFLVSKSPDARPPMMLNEVATGAGKTLVYLTVMAIKYSMLDGDGFAYPDDTGIVSTYTRHLRKEIVLEIPTIRRVLEKMANDGHPIDPTVDISPVVSKTSLFSVEKLRHCDPSSEMLQWVLDRYKVCAQAYDALVESNDIEAAKATRFPVLGEYDGPTPCDIPAEEFCLDRDGETNHDDANTAISLIQMLNGHAKTNSRIMVVTHALLIINSIRFGSVLGTTLEVGDDKRFDIVIDEADRYKDQAIGMWRFSANLTDFFKIIKKNTTGAGMRARQKTIADCEKRLTNMGVIDDDIQYIEIAEMEQPLATIVEACRDNITDPIERSRTMETWSYIKTVAAFLRDVNRTTTLQGFANVVHEVVDLGGEKFLTGTPTDHGYLASRLWYSTRSMSIGRVALYSGTITGVSTASKTCVRTFARRSGIWSKIPMFDPRTNTVVECGKIVDLSTQILPSDRHIGNLVVSSNIVLPRYTTDGEPNNPYWDRIASIIDNLADDLDATTLVLFPSRKTHDYVFGGLNRDCIVRNGDGNIEEATLRDTRGEKSIIFSTNWRGVNYVRDRKTFVKRIVIPALPVPPSPDKRRDLCTTKHNLLQGLGRAMRHEGDEFDLWVCDPRFRPSRCRVGGDKIDKELAALSDSIFAGSLGEKLSTYREFSLGGEMSQPMPMLQV